MTPDFSDADPTKPESVCEVFPATAWASAARCTVFARLARESPWEESSQFNEPPFPRQPGKDAGQRQPMQRREKLRPCSSASKSFPLMLRYRFVVRDPCKVEVMPPHSKAAGAGWVLFVRFESRPKSRNSYKNNAAFGGMPNAAQFLLGASSNSARRAPWSAAA